MKQHGRQPAATPVFVDPGLEKQWQDALLSRPDRDDPAALAAWNQEHDELRIAYQQAIEQAQKATEKAEKEQKGKEKARTQLHRKVAVVVTGVILLISGVGYWSSLPSEDEIRQEKRFQQDAACTLHYEQTHHLKLVSKQIDLLENGEGGWIELYPYSGERPVGGLNLSPSELQTGNTGEAHVDREDYVYDSTIGVGEGGLLERQGDRLVLTLFSNLSGFGELPHAPLQVDTTSTVTVRGERLSSACWQ